MTKDSTTVRFTYRADGLRARKEVVGGLTIDYVYDGQTVVGETRSDGTSSWYTPGPSGYISRTDLDSAGNVTNKEWFVYDGLGSCRALVKPNAQGTEAVLVARYDYDVYGAVRTQSGSSANQFKYVASIGHPTDEETGLIYMRARYYDAGTGRFVSEDPGKHSQNWYWYADANSVRYVDPTGKLAAETLAAFLEWLGKWQAWEFGVLDPAIMAKFGPIQGLNEVNYVKGLLMEIEAAGADIARGLVQTKAELWKAIAKVRGYLGFGFKGSQAWKEFNLLIDELLGIL